MLVSTERNRKDFYSFARQKHTKLTMSQGDVESKFREYMRKYSKDELRFLAASRGLMECSGFKKAQYAGILAGRKYRCPGKPIQIGGRKPSPGRKPGRKPSPGRKPGRQTSLGRRMSPKEKAWLDQDFSVRELSSMTVDRLRGMAKLYKARVSVSRMKKKDLVTTVRRAALDWYRRGSRGKSPGRKPSKSPGRKPSKSPRFENVRALKKRAKAMGLKNYSRLRRDELLALLGRAQAQPAKKPVKVSTPVHIPTAPPVPVSSSSDDGTEDVKFMEKPNKQCVARPKKMKGRKAPSHSATACRLGLRAEKDNQWWEVKEFSNGLRRWVKVKGP